MRSKTDKTPFVLRIVLHRKKDNLLGPYFQCFGSNHAKNDNPVCMFSSMSKLVLFTIDMSVRSKFLHYYCCVVKKCFIHWQLHYAVPFPISLLIWFQIITQPPQHEKESFIGGRQKWAYINNPISSRNMCCATLSQLDSSYNRWARLPRRRFVSSSDRNTIFVCFREGVIVYGSDSLTGIWQLLIKR